VVRSLEMVVHIAGQLSLRGASVLSLRGRREESERLNASELGRLMDWKEREDARGTHDSERIMLGDIYMLSKRI
jgi:hypothetical protein